MFCNKCGKEIKEEWEFCNYCGASISSPNQNNDTENVSNNVVNNVTRVRKVNKKQIIFIVVFLIVVIICISYGMFIYNSSQGLISDTLNNNGKNDKNLSNLIEKSNTYTGMSFKISKEEFEQNYLNELNNNIMNYELGEFFMDESFTILDNNNVNIQNNTTTYKHCLYRGYPYRTQYFAIYLEVENNTNKLISVNGIYDYNISKELSDKSMRCIISAMKVLENTSTSEIIDTFEELLEKNETYEFKNNILYQTGTVSRGGKDYASFKVSAITKEMYEKLLQE